MESQQTLLLRVLCTPLRRCEAARQPVRAAQASRSRAPFACCFGARGVRCALSTRPPCEEVLLRCPWRRHVFAAPFLRCALFAARDAALGRTRHSWRHSWRLCVRRMHV